MGKIYLQPSMEIIDLPGEVITNSNGTQFVPEVQDLTY